MIVVSDTSPLNYLVLIGQDRILPTLFGRVIAPPAVIGELLHPGAPALIRSWAASPPEWLEVLAPSVVDQSLPLGLGETEAISLAREIHADTLLLDERRAVLVARGLGLAVTGTLGVLELAAERQLIDLADVVVALRKTTFRCSDNVFEELLRRDKQRQSKSTGRQDD
ncbi:MAG: DUF3368 domain-containing protein [Pirellulales bacterium]